jgi:quercetin dioxygenase-like cupin family protein
MIFSLYLYIKITGMPIKINEATKNRPGGTRVLDAPAVLVHLPHYQEMIKHEKAWQEGDRNGITVFKNEDISVVLTTLEPGAKLENVQVRGYSTLNLLKGKISMKAGDDTKEAETGDLLIFHPFIIYSIEAVEESSFVLTHYASEENKDGEVF